MDRRSIREELTAVPFSDNAIGFYLQLEDQMTPVFTQAQRQYDRMAKSLQATTRQVQKIGGSMQAQLVETMNAFKDLPKAVSTAFKKAYDGLQTEIKKRGPVKVPIAVSVDTKTAGGGLRRAIREGVQDAFKKAWMYPTVPPKNASGFQRAPRGTTTFYRGNVPTPPFYRMRFAAGGRVPGPRGSGDTVPAMLSPGEAVIPVDLTNRLSRSLSGSPSGKAVTLPSSLSKGLSRVLSGGNKSGRFQTGGVAGEPLGAAFIATLAQMSQKLGSGFHVMYPRTGQLPLRPAWQTALSPIAAQLASLGGVEGSVVRGARAQPIAGMSREQVEEMIAGIREYRTQFAGVSEEITKFVEKNKEAGEPLVRMFREQLAVGKKTKVEFRELNRMAKERLKIIRDQERADERLAKATNRLAKEQAKAERSRMQDPMHFMALSNALNIIGSTVTETLWESMNDINKTFGLTRNELAGLRLAIRDANKEWQATPSQVGQAAEALVQLGARQDELRAGFASVAAVAETAFGVPRGAAAQLSLDLSRLGMDTQRVAAFFVDMGNAAKRGEISAGDLGATLAQQLGTIRGTLRDLGPEGARQVVTGLTQMQAAITKIGGPEVGQQIGQLLTRVLSGEIVPEAARLFGAGTQEEMVRLLQSREGMQQMMRQLTAWGQAGGTPTQMKALAEALGGTLTGPQLLDLSKRMGDVTAAMKLMVSGGISLDKAIEKMNQQAKDATGWFDRLAVSVSKFVGDAGDRLIAFFKELNPLMMMQYWWVARELGLLGRGGAAGMVGRAAKGVGTWGGLAGMMGGTRMARGLHLGGQMVARGAVGSGLGVAAKGLGLGALASLGTILKPVLWAFRALTGPLGILVTLIIVFRKELGAFIDGVWKGFQASSEKLKEAFATAASAWSRAFGVEAENNLDSWTNAGNTFGTALGKLAVVVVELSGWISHVVVAFKGLALWAGEIIGLGGKDWAVRFRAELDAWRTGQDVREEALAKGKTPLEAERLAAEAQKQVLHGALLRARAEASGPGRALARVSEVAGVAGYAVPVAGLEKSLISSISTKTYNWWKGSKSSADMQITKYVAQLSEYVTAGKISQAELDAASAQARKDNSAGALLDLLEKAEKAEKPQRPPAVPAAPAPTKTSFRFAPRPVSALSLLMTGGVIPSRHPTLDDALAS